MTNIQKEIRKYQDAVAPFSAKLIAISKTKPISDIKVAYEAGQLEFGENKVQELANKYEDLPKDIKWHMVGHLQRNKVKYIAPFVHLIHSVDSIRLLKEINKEGAKNHRRINILLQVFIATEDTKFGLDRNEVVELLNSEDFKSLNNIKVIGLMGMASHTDNQEQVSAEFNSLKSLLEELKSKYNSENVELTELSMGMSGDYQIALKEGSTIIRIGSSIFGERNYAKQNNT